MRLPSSWNRPRATALLATLLLHLAAAYWLLALRFETPDKLAEDQRFLWLPDAQTPPPPPVESELPSAEAAPIRAAPLRMPVPEVPPATEPDWSATARDVAKDRTAVPTYQRFGEIPKGPQQRPSEAYPPSIFDKPLPRIGKTVTTAEGETIIWVSDYCYVSISSRSLTQKEIHDARKGVRTCVLAQWGAEKKARDDLFDPIKRPPPPQEPGCNKEGVGQSCGR